ncbi:MAG: hypothetical protein K8W52_30240 [Deltaproteobacteria bacterium]|nr:hypothetical protein [Deltaproteobacteria bacterium]
MPRSPLLATLISLCAACGAKHDAPPAGSAAPPTPAGSAAPATATAPTAKPATKGAKGAKPAAPAPTKAARAAYRKHLSAGRKLGAAKRWGEATTEFEAALAAVPKDGRALAELGLAAYAAGDYKKARRANNDAVRVAAEPKVKAASFYNLGLIAEAEHDQAGAAAAYAASLALRPGNATVIKALTKLGKTPPTPGETFEDPPCSTPVALDKLCACLTAADPAAVPDDPSEPRTPYCEHGDSLPTDDDTLSITAKVPTGYELFWVDVSDDHEATLFLAAGSGDAWRIVSALEGTYNPGMFGINEELAVPKIEIRTVGARKVLWIETHHVHNDSDAGINEAETAVTDSVLVCPIGDDKTPTRCVLDVPVVEDYTRDVLLDDADADPDVVHSPGLPIHGRTELAIALGADGIATVTLKSGTAPDRPGLLGPHKLW